MIFFIVILRALATCLITNSHYVGVYPSDIIANGGLLGDVIFFAVSGYCLAKNNKSFPRWYGKRLWRIYPAVILITVFYFYIIKHDLFVLRKQHIHGFEEFAWWYIHPTFYHFVASIILLYVPYYFVSRYEFLRKRIPLLATAVAVIFLGYYLIFYDKTHYHIDAINEWQIRFLFFESMLLGGYFRYNDDKFRNKFHWSLPLITAALFVGYFASKMLFSRYAWLAPAQIVNQFIIFALLFFVFWLFASLDEKLEKLPKPIKACLGYLASITLEIYLVQQVIVNSLVPHFKFPINWVVITASILAAATVLHCVCKLIYWSVDKLIEILKSKFVKKEETA
ncbi:MAG: acyltransferase [Clostridia bacterium]|nr:acyltransferase [Clostridia bacterium]